MAARFAMGLEGFVWFVGVVEDRQDPERLGRVRVRCFGWHTDDKTLIPTDSLPWAHTVFGVNVSNAFHTPKEGDMVFGFFMDADAAQNPVITGVIPGKPTGKPTYTKGFSDPNKKYPKRINEPTTSRLSRGRTDDTVVATRKNNLVESIKSAGDVSWSEPDPGYAMQYPFNFVLESESGHAIELDDTPEKERVHIAHKNGSFIEFYSKGDRVEKVTKDKYTLVMGDDYVLIAGDCNITISGDCNLKVGGRFNLEAEEINMIASKDTNIKSKTMKQESDEDFNIYAGKECKIGAATKSSLSGGVNATLQGAVIDLAAAKVNIQSGSASEPDKTGLEANFGGELFSKAQTNSSTIPVENLIVIKGFNGGTFTQPGVTGLYSNIDSLSSRLSTDIPIDTLSAELEDIENTLNEQSGAILALEQTEQAVMKEKIAKLRDAAKSRGLEFKVDESVLSTESRFEYVTGKRLYPSTELVRVDKED